MVALRVAFVGKGGAGKSSIAGTFARQLARRGEKVLAVDSDPMPGLSFSLGLGAIDVAIPDEAVQDQPEGSEGPRIVLREGLTAATAVERYATVGPDGVYLLQFGKLRGAPAELARSQVAFRQIVAELPVEAFSIVGDLPGGTRQPFFGWARYAATVLVVVEPTAKSVLSARRLARLARDKEAPQQILAVVSKARTTSDAEMVRAKTGLDVVASIPWDPALVESDRLGVSLMDYASASPAAKAVESLLRAIAPAVVA